MRRIKQHILRIFFAFLTLVSLVAATQAAPYAAVVMDARDGRIIYSRDPHKPLHPASLTKMMTLYIAFAEVEAGRIGLNQKIKVSSNAASQPPSRMGLKSGHTIELRYLLRAAAIKSGNDAATAIGDAISGSEAEFAKYMTEVARSLGMKNTQFKNANGLTQQGHYSTAYDMAILGRRLVYDFPQYYNLFSRDYAETPMGNLPNSNRRFLKDYPGADGIKTGYTRAAGYNLVASSKRGNKRIIVSMFGGQSSYQRNEQVGALLDLGFREAKNRVAFSNFPKVRLNGPVSKSVSTASASPSAPTAAPKTQATLSTKMPSAIARPPSREGDTAPIQTAAAAPVVTEEPSLVTKNSTKMPSEISMPTSRPSNMSVAPTSVVPPVTETAKATATTPIVPPSNNTGDFAVQLAALPSQNEAEKQLIATSLSELESLGNAKNMIIRVSLNGTTMYRPRFSEISKEAAYRACAKLQARNEECYVIAPEYGG